MSNYLLRNLIHLFFKKGHLHLSKKGLEYCEKTGISFSLWEEAKVDQYDNEKILYCENNTRGNRT